VAPCVRVVFDTNVLLSLYVFADSRFAPLRARVACGQWRALSSDACLTEFERVLSYPEFALDKTKQINALTDYRAQLERVAIPDTDTPPPYDLPRCKDRDDQKFLELARAGNASVLITADKALLVLARRGKMRGRFDIITPDAALLLP
jgi:uncharacterized protein